MPNDFRLTVPAHCKRAYPGRLPKPLIGHDFRDASGRLPA